MIDFKTKDTISLVDFCKQAGKPVVLNFGSCTWPPFMKALTNFNDFRNKYEGPDDALS